MIAIKATMRVAYLCVKENAFAAVVPTDYDKDATLSALTIGSLSPVSYTHLDVYKRQLYA